VKYVVVAKSVEDHLRATLPEMEFGSFTDRASAEQCVVALAGRPGIYHASVEIKR
jgi:hypothetical protein